MKKAMKRKKDFSLEYQQKTWPPVPEPSFLKLKDQSKFIVFCAIVRRAKFSPEQILRPAPNAKLFR